MVEFTETADQKYCQPIEQPDWEGDPRRELFGIDQDNLFLEGEFYTTREGKTGLTTNKDGKYIDIVFPNGEEETINTEVFNYIASTSAEKEKWIRQTQRDPSFNELMCDEFEKRT